MIATRLVVAGPIAAIACAIAACAGTHADAGLDARLRVEGAQFHRGAMPAAEDGPLVKSVALSPIVPPGASDRACSGTVDPAATAVALSLPGDPGYWVVPTGLPDVTAPGFPTFAASLSFARTLPSGTTTFVARAVDGGGRFGPPLLRPLTVASSVPAGRLVISLSWGNRADLDLFVLDPRGVEISKRNINSYEPPPPGSPPEPPGTPHPGGILDVDSNASCVPDGKMAENLVYADPPPPGRYQIRVDTASLCDEPNAYWRVEARIEGLLVGQAEGLATEHDARAPHDRGAGLLALEITVP